MKITHVLFSAVLFSITSWAAFVPAQRPYDVLNYRITLRLDPAADPKTFRAETQIRLRTTRATPSIELDGEELQIETVELLPSRTSLAFEMVQPKKVVVALPYPTASGVEITLAITYNAKINSTQNGFFKVTDPDEPQRGNLYFTHFEPLAARSFFPANDEPYDKATTEMIVTVPAGTEALSNGLVVSDTTTSESGRAWRTLHWVQDQPHSTYLVSLAVGKFSKISAQHGDKEVSIWLSPGKVERGRYVLDATLKSMHFFERFLGVPYPWRKYSTVALPTFIWGGMENTSSTHMNQDRTLLNDPMSEEEKTGITALSSHELAHQWFGDYATLHWWDDLWLNETFANYLDGEATAAAFDTEEIEIHRVRRAWDRYFRQENGPRSHPIVDKELVSPDEAFDAIAYTKGENVLRMLEFYVGRDQLRAGMKGYLERFATSNATYRDFFDSVAKASGKNLDAFRDTWLLQRGYPVVKYSGTWNDGKYALTLSQHSNHAGDRSLFHYRLPVVFHRKSAPAYDRAMDWEISAAEHRFIVDLPAEPEWVSVNPSSVVLAEVLQAQRDEAALAIQALQDPNALIRVRAIYDLTTALLQGTGTLSPLAEKTAETLLTTDTSPYVRMALLTSIVEMKTRWLPNALGKTVLNLAQAPAPSAFNERALRLWRAHLWQALGKVSNPKAMALLAHQLSQPQLPLDELASASLGVALLGNGKGISMLKEAIKRHEKRGYRYRYVIQYAFGAYANPAAAREIRSILAQCNADLAGRMGYLVSNNQTLKNSPQWAEFLTGFLARDLRHGEEVHSRLLQSVEEVKTAQVNALLSQVMGSAPSERIKQLARKIRDKNFNTPRS